MLPKAALRKHAKGQSDHLDAWLMSYADLITLLCMFFAISVSVQHITTGTPEALEKGEHPVEHTRYGLLELRTPFDGAYRALEGIIATHGAEGDIGLEQNGRALSIDISAVKFFEPGSAEIPAYRMPLIRAIADTLQQNLSADYAIEVGGYTDDTAPAAGNFANNWELSAMRSARVVNLLIEAGLDASRLRATSHAGNQPVVPNTDAEGAPIPKNRAHNQRVVISVEKAVTAPRDISMNLYAP